MDDKQKLENLIEAIGKASKELDGALETLNTTQKVMQECGQFTASLQLVTAIATVQNLQIALWHLMNDSNRSCDERCSQCQPPTEGSRN